MSDSVPPPQPRPIPMPSQSQKANEPSFSWEERPEDPGLFVVAQRPGKGSWQWLLPFLIVGLGAGFLAYRSTRADWRGISALFERSHAKEPTALALNAPPSEPAPPVAAPEAPKPGDVDDAPEDRPPADEVASAKDQEKDADPLDDIQREAEKTRERLAELQKLKDNAKLQQEATEDQRKQERQQARFRGIPADQLGRMIAMQREMLRKQMAWMEDMQRQQFNEMSDMQRRFLGRGFEMPRFRGLPIQPPAGFDAFPPPLVPEFGMGIDQKDGKEIVEKTPAGVTRFRRFNGPGGSSGFVFEFRSGPGADAGEVPPPQSRAHLPRFD